MKNKKKILTSIIILSIGIFSNYSYCEKKESSLDKKLTSEEEIYKSTLKLDTPLINILRDESIEYGTLSDMIFYRKPFKKADIKDMLLFLTKMKGRDEVISIVSSELREVQGFSEKLDKIAIDHLKEAYKAVKKNGYMGKKLKTKVFKSINNIMVDDHEMQIKRNFLLFSILDKLDKYDYLSRDFLLNFLGPFGDFLDISDTDPFLFYTGPILAKQLSKKSFKTYQILILSTMLEKEAILFQLEKKDIDNLIKIIKDDSNPLRSYGAVSFISSMILEKLTLHNVDSPGDWQDWWESNRETFSKRDVAIKNWKNIIKYDAKKHNETYLCILAFKDETILKFLEEDINKRLKDKNLTKKEIKELSSLLTHVTNNFYDFKKETNDSINLLLKELE